MSWAMEIDSSCIRLILHLAFPAGAMIPPRKHYKLGRDFAGVGLAAAIDLCRRVFTRRYPGHSGPKVAVMELDWARLNERLTSSLILNLWRCFSELSALLQTAKI